MMPCEHFKLPDGIAGIMCSRHKPQRKCACGKPATRLCDFVVNRLGDTCDRPVCTDHATSVGPDLDHCPEHAAPRAKQLTLEGL